MTLLLIPLFSIFYMGSGPLMTLRSPTAVWTGLAYRCLEGGDMTARPSKTPNEIPPLDFWRLTQPTLTSKPIAFSFPYWLGAAIFCGCNLGSMWFYNFMIKAGGHHSWHNWSTITTKLCCPTVEDRAVTLHDTFDKDNPIEP